MYRRVFGSTLLLCSFAVAALTTPASATSRQHHRHHSQTHKSHSGSPAEPRAETRQAQASLTDRFGLARLDQPTGLAITGFRRPAALSADVVAEARRWIGTNPTGRRSLWCARFMNQVLKHTGHDGTGSDLARSFARYGHRVAGPRVGAIAVMSRGRRGGHVGVVSGVDANGNPIIISGNHSRRVAEAVYPRGRIYAYVMPES
ncbi:MAG TPA: TIGR02594 family protein [Burkholderiales bacterium]|jgi:uncharacterized protein (TIGR02594 family)